MILVDMEMPKSCDGCPLCDRDCCEQRSFNLCKANNGCRVYMDGVRNKDCPIKAEIPDNATNGDVIKAMFPNCRYEHEKRWDLKWGHLNFKGNTCPFQVDDKWWNAPYKSESEVLDADSN